MAKATKAKASSKVKSSKATSSKAKATKSAKSEKAKPVKKDKLEALDETGRRVEDAPVANERRKNHRRRQIDPTTCEREYKDAEIEFMHALDEYKRASGRMFPTCSEILEVLMKLGYRQVAEAQEIYNPNQQEEGTTEFHAENDFQDSESELETEAIS